MSDPTDEVDQERLLASTNAAVWAEEFAKIVPDVDRGLMVAWFANAIETAKTHARPAERTDVPPEGEYVVLPRGALFEFFGRMALPPWEENGEWIGGKIDCAPIASEIAEWVDVHDLAAVVFDPPVDGVTRG